MLGEVPATEVDLVNGRGDDVSLEYRYDTDDPVADVQHDGICAPCRAVGQDALCADMETFGAEFLEHNLVIKDFNEKLNTCGNSIFLRDFK